MIKPPGRPNLALADFVAPRRRGVADYVGAFAVTAGHGLDELVAAFEAQHDDYNAILAKALADRLAEAFAERLHERVRREFWGYAPDEALDNDGADPRAVPGHPAGAGLSRLPRPHREAHAVRSARAEAQRGHHADRELRHAARPPSVSGCYFWHPEARYFGVGKIGRDQVEDYAAAEGAWTSPTMRALARPQPRTTSGSVPTAARPA